PSRRRTLWAGSGRFSTMPDFGGFPSPEASRRPQQGNRKPKLLKLLQSVFGSRNDRMVRRYAQLVRSANAFEPRMKALSDAELRAKTDEFRERLKGGATLDELLPEAFAAVREASMRTLKMRHFDVQLIGGIALHQGKIAEMRTGEGKTLVATLPAYLNALP